MNDRDILRHDRVNIFGSEKHSDLPAGCEAIARFANIAIFSGKLNGFKVGQVRGPASLQALLDALWLDFKWVNGLKVQNSTGFPPESRCDP